MFTAETKIIRISTLEKKTKRTIEQWINDWLEEGDSVEFHNYNEPWAGGSRIQAVLIGDPELGELVEYVPVKWKCPECGRWNYELTYHDGAGAMAICDHCKAEGEF